MLAGSLTVGLTELLLQVHPQRRPPPLGRDIAGHQLRARLSSAVPAEPQQQDGVSQENDQGNTVSSSDN